MPPTWISTSSINVEGLVNSITAACDGGFVPAEFYFIENPGTEAVVADAIEFATSVVQAYGGAPPEVHVTTLDHETDFDRILIHVKEAIEAAHERGGEVAVDITPGRKFMSAIAFAAGLRYDADHVFYFYLASAEHHGRLYPEIPRPATELYDFTEVI